MKVQPNYHSQQSFGMAMFVEKSARPAIEKGGRNLLNKIQKAGETVKETKLVHLIIDEGAVPVIETPYANRYSTFFEPKEPGMYPEFLHVNTIWAGRASDHLKTGDMYTACIKLENTEAAQKAYESLKAAQSDIERGAILTKILDDKYLAEEAERKVQAELKKELLSDVDNLFEKHGR